LRHYFASHAQEMGMNPLLVQGVLGHTTLGMTARYTHLSTDMARQALQQVFQKAGLGAVGSAEAPKQDA
jgi:site-specific recombinase XerD